MRITVEFYGVLNQLMGRERMTLESVGTTVAEVLEQLHQEKPQMKEQMPRLACAINNDLVHREHPLTEDCTLALIPPVSGGSR